MQKTFKKDWIPVSVLKYIGLSLAMMSASASAAGFQDGGFVEQEWQQITVVQNGSSAILSVQENGGNPDQYWLAKYTLPASSSALNTRLRIANINTAFSYDTATAGPLQSMDFSMDLRGFSSSFVVAGYYAPAILQGGQVYIVENTFKQVDVGNWSTVDWHFDNTNQWVTLDGQISPGFGNSGGILHFGYIYGLSTVCSNGAGCLAANTVSGLDNYQVTLNAVPEPQTYSMFFAGLCLMAAFSRTSSKRINTSRENNHA